jgi:hypothetical protein
MLEAWHDFYLLVGGASGGLIGLLFVVASLTTSIDADNAMRAARLYMTPNLFHFAAVLTLSALAMAPGISDPLAGALVIAAGLCGVAYTLTIGLALPNSKAPDPPHWSDFWCYAVVPGVIYVGVGVAGVELVRAADVAPRALAAALLALMYITIRNAWNLITWIAPRRGG